MINTINLQENGMPGFGKQTKAAIKDYVVRVYKGDLDSLEDVTFIEDIMTRSMSGEDIVLLERDKCSDKSQYFMILVYLEKRHNP
jgi:hypothetical protein